MRNPKSIALYWAFALGTAAIGLPAAAADQPHNIVLFIPDGLRALMVSQETAPRMAAIRDKGINFKNPHSLFPTFTTPNASAMATGHYLGDTGDFSNVIYSGFPVPGAGDSLTPFLESDPVLGDVDEHFAGDYLDEVTLLNPRLSAEEGQSARRSRGCGATGAGLCERAFRR
jgi:Type I phosphodiesterase / nucleotide pyrophosphatase